MKKRLLKESGGDVSKTIEHLEEYLDKLMSIGKNKGIFQDKSKRDELNKLGHKMLVSFSKMGAAIAGYHPPHDNHSHDHDHDHDHDNKHRHSKEHRGGYDLPINTSSPTIKREQVIKLNETDLLHIVKRVLKEGGEKINDVVNHIEDEMDNLHDAAMEKGLYGDFKIGSEMSRLYRDAMISFKSIVKHIEDYHPKSDKNHNKDIKNTKHSAPIASNNKVN